jgi:hypothetical protein
MVTNSIEGKGLARKLVWENARDGRLYKVNFEV